MGLGAGLEVCPLLHLSAPLELWVQFGVGRGPRGLTSLPDLTLAALGAAPLPRPHLWRSLRSRSQLISPLVVTHHAVADPAHGGYAFGGPNSPGPLSLPCRYWPGDPHGRPSGVSEGAERTLRAGRPPRPWLLALCVLLPSPCQRPRSLPHLGAKVVLPATAMTCPPALPGAPPQLGGPADFVLWGVPSFIQ